jgi:superfamily II DNA or RNA helicase
MKRLIYNRPLIINSKLTLERPTPEEVEQLKEHLTFDNPAYLSAKRYSRYSKVTIPPYITYYRNMKTAIEVPLGTDIDSFISMKHTRILDERMYSKVKVTVPKFKMTLREDQEKAHEAFIRLNRNPLQRNGLIQLPTGMGKSVLGLAIAHTLSLKTLIVVHKDDLVIGWMNDIKEAFEGKVKAGLIKAQKRVIGDFITIATIQTLNRLKPAELDLLHDTFGLVIQDEAHHCPASTFSVVSDFNSRYKLALTATPERNDGLTHVLHLYFGGFAFQHVLTGKEKDILPVEVIRKDSGLYFNPVFLPVTQNGRKIFQLVDLYAERDTKLSNGQIKLSEIYYKERPSISFQELDDWVIRQPLYREMVIEDILREAGQGHSCVVFFTQKEHCNIFFDRLNLFSILNGKVQTYNGDTKDNAEAIRKANDKEVLVTLTTYAKGTEGTNVNAWEVEFLVSSLNNEKNAEQASGRIRRLKEGKLETALLYDYRHSEVYSMSSHGATRDRRFKKLGFSFRGQKKSKSPHSHIFNRGI